MTDTHSKTLAEAKRAAEQIFPTIAQLPSLPEQDSGTVAFDVEATDREFSVSATFQRLCARFSHVYQAITLVCEPLDKDDNLRDLDDYDYEFLAHLIDKLVAQCQPEGYAIALMQLDLARKEWVKSRFADSEFTIDLGTGTLTAYWAREDTPYKSTTECLREAFAAETKEQ